MRPPPPNTTRTDTLFPDTTLVRSLLPGDNLSKAPEQGATGSVAWTPDIGSSGLTGLVYIDGRRTSDYNTGSDLFPQKAQDGYALFNARLGVRGPDEKWGIELWAQNIFNKDRKSTRLNSSH